MKLTNATIETGLSGPDWRDIPNATYYAQIFVNKSNYYAFGPTPEDAWAALLVVLTEAQGE